MINKTSLWLAAALLFPVSAEALTIGPSQTKKERERQSVSRGRASGGSYEKIVESFLKEDFAGTERSAARYLARSPRNAAYDEISYFRALSLMKLARFEEARPILSSLEEEAFDPAIRSQAAFSLGDSYYFKNLRAQADAHYQEALRKYPDADEAQTIRKVLGISSAARPETPPAGMSPASFSRQWATEEVPLYTVQVGSFARERNAERLLNKLLRNRYDAYISHEEASSHFRVRVGRLPAAEEARMLEDRLKKDGYPTKIFP